MSTVAVKENYSGKCLAMIVISRMSRERGVTLLALAAAVVVALLFPQAAGAHMMITGSALDVAVYRDRITVRADIMPYEIDAIQSNLGDSCNDPDKELASYCRHLVTHLHFWADGKPLNGKILRFTRPTNLHDPTSRAVCEMEYRASTPALWPSGAKDGSVEIHHSILSGPNGENLTAYIVDLSYAVRICQEGRPAKEGLLLTQGEGVTFLCEWKTAASGAAPQTQPAAAVPVQPAPRSWFRLPDQDDIMAIVTMKRLSVPLIVAAFLMVLIWGAAHALSPGHGKAIVAGYLIGSRSTARHAVFLALTVTLTHTSAVFILGAVAYFTLRSQIPWRFLPWIGTLSGLLIVVLGGAMFVSRLRGLSRGRALTHEHGHDPLHDRTHAHGDHHHDHGPGFEQGHDHGHAQAEHLHEHDHDHGHGSDHDHQHDHQHHHHGHDHGHGHSHLPPGADGKPVTWRSLLGLGISGGLLPCPSALFLLLAMVAINRTGLGIALVVAFSFGLAAVLTAIGLIFVKGGKLVSRIPHGARTLRFLPLASALFILAVGVWLTFEAVCTIRL